MWSTYVGVGMGSASYPGRALILGVALVGSLTLGVAGGRSAAAGRASSSLPRCKPADYSFEVAALRNPLSSRKPLGLTAGVVASARLAHPCALMQTARLAVESDSRKVLPASQIKGNNATWRISATLRPFRQVVHTWVWRNWCGASGDFRVRGVLSDGKSSGGIAGPAPRCAQSDAPSALLNHGSGTRNIVGFTPDRIPAHILPKNTPPPLSPELIVPTNAWLVSDGYTLVAVYAGHAGPSAKKGMFAVVRQNLVFGIQYTPPGAAGSVAYLGNLGAAHITTAPKGRAVETSAQHGRIHFATTNGAHGVLNLARDTVTLSK